MRSLASASVTPINRLITGGNERRSVRSFFDGITCMALVLHGETDKAIKVSDDGEPAHFVWLPRAMVTIAKEDRGRFLVVTMSLAFSQQKRLQLRFIDPAKFPEAERAQLRDAVAAAARARNGLREAGGHRAISRAYRGGAVGA